jgi:hypothetical protein
VSSLTTIARGFRCGQSALAIAAAETLGQFVDNVPTKMHYQMLAQSGVVCYINRLLSLLVFAQRMVEMFWLTDLFCSGSTR